MAQDGRHVVCLLGTVRMGPLCADSDLLGVQFVLTVITAKVTGSRAGFSNAQAVCCELCMRHPIAEVLYCTVLYQLLKHAWGGCLRT